MRLFWGRNWFLRGVSFQQQDSTTNIHYRDLVFLTGKDWKIKKIVGIRTWKRLFKVLFMREN